MNHSNAARRPLSATSRNADAHDVPRRRLLLAALLFAAAGGAHATCPGTPPPVTTPVCDGTADDTSALQSLIHAASLNGAPAVIPVTPNGCRVTAPLEVCSNTTVIQRGLLKAKTSWSPSGSPFGVYNIADGATDVRIEGGGVVDGSSVATASGITSGGATLGDYPSSTPNAQRVTIHGMTIVNMGQWPIRIDGTDNLRIDGVTAKNSHYGLEVGHDTKNAALTNLRVSGIEGNCVVLYRGVTESTVSNSLVSDCGGVGIYVLSDRPTGYPASHANGNVTIDGNIAREALVGIQVGNSPTGAVATGVNISANQAHHNRTYGIGVVPCDSCQITSNMTHHNGNAEASYQPGILVANSRQVKVAANTVYNEGQGTTTGLGIVVIETTPGLAAGARVNVTGNLVYDDQSPKTMVGALGGALAAPIVSTGNSFSSGLLDYFSYATGSVQRNYLTP
ncbi:right-handed parallel beta-helix repeat-containing protein [Tahibacter caeni]|uniref:right-handed parallel beta-helix repeat-containing protein n=1 Tax=Tahibacter caeni TaxID=1453545 RepID=UPI0021474475|nr:right-handed parallel beta-helix repeat-containing protein [Tahibacter caeni]